MTADLSPAPAIPPEADTKPLRVEIADLLYDHRKQRPAFGPIMFCDDLKIADVVIAVLQRRMKCVYNVETVQK